MIVFIFIIIFILILTIVIIIIVIAVLIIGITVLIVRVFIVIVLIGVVLLVVISIIERRIGIVTIIATRAEIRGVVTVDILRCAPRHRWNGHFHSGLSFHFRLPRQWSNQPG